MCDWDIQGTGLVEMFYVPIMWGLESGQECFVYNDQFETDVKITRTQHRRPNHKQKAV